MAWDPKITTFPGLYVLAAAVAPPLTEALSALASLSAWAMQAARAQVKVKAKGKATTAGARC